MYCPKCGTQNPDGARVCGACGTVLTPATAPPGGQIPKTSGLALAAFILGLISVLFFPVGLVAIILGIAGIIAIEKSGGRLTGTVFAVLGIVVPVLVFLLVFVLMMAMVPALNRVKKQARSVRCQANLKQWGLVSAMYTDDNNGRFFSGRTNDTERRWMEPFRPYCHDTALWLCPQAMTPYAEGGSDPFGAWEVGDDSSSYGLNGWVHNLQQGETELRGRGPAGNYWGTSNVRGANNVPVLMDAMWFEAWPRQEDEPPPQADWLTDMVNEREMGANDNEMRRFCVDRHQGYVNGLFLDWSVRKVGLKELWTLKWHRAYNTGGPRTRAGGAQPTDWPEWMRKLRDY